MMNQSTVPADFSTIFETVADIKIDSNSVYDAVSKLGLDLAIEREAKLQLFFNIKNNRQKLNIDPEQVSSLVKTIYGYMEEDYLDQVITSFEAEYK